MDGGREKGRFLLKGFDGGPDIKNGIHSSCPPRETSGITKDEPCLVALDKAPVRVLH
jgi:hypothetical protein